jgi:hypothetical protein
MSANVAVQDFWKSDPQYTSAEAHMNFVEWAISAEDNEPSPFTWASVDETDSDNIVMLHPLCLQHYANKHQVYKGSFQSPAILTTFSTHLASISLLPSNMLTGTTPEGALSMATTSVCPYFITNETY